MPIANHNTLSLTVAVFFRGFTYAIVVLTVLVLAYASYRTRAMFRQASVVYGNEVFCQLRQLLHTVFGRR